MKMKKTEFSSTIDLLVNNEIILVVNDYTIVDVSPNPLSVRQFTITFMYIFDFDSHKTFQLKQGTVKMISHAESTQVTIKF